MSRPLLSVVVPALDEAAALPGLLEGLHAQRGICLEVLVVDGGSGDGTPEIAAEHGVRVIAARRGRGAQMNAGAAAATGEWLLFLHADCRPGEPDQLRLAVDSLRACGNRRTAGHFALRFRRERHDHRFLYRLMEAKSAESRRYTINGDQGLLLRREWFEALGGFDESLPFLEDQRIAARIEAEGVWVLLPGCLIASARRFETEGLGARYLLMTVIMAMHTTGELDFFEAAPEVYRAQADTGRLQVSPFLDLVWRLYAAKDRAARRAFRRRLGAVVLSQTWQPALMLDVALRRDGRPWLRVHDRWLRPLLQRRFLEPPVGWLTLACARRLLTPWCRRRERRRLGRVR